MEDKKIKISLPVSANNFVILDLTVEEAAKVFVQVGNELDKINKENPGSPYAEILKDTLVYLSGELNPNEAKNFCGILPGRSKPRREHIEVEASVQQSAV